MKKTIAWLLVALMALSAFCALAEDDLQIEEIPLMDMADELTAPEIPEGLALPIDAVEPEELLILSNDEDEAEKPYHDPRFPDDAFWESLLASFDQNGDGRLSDDECRKVTTLYVYADSCEGIQYFPNLKELHCEGGMTRLDVSGCAQLAKLYVSGDSLTKLTLGKSAALKTLSCIRTGLGKLNVSGYAGLKTLVVSDNSRLTDLDASGCAKLTTLDISNNARLAGVNVSRCASLKALKVNDHSSLTSLNASRCAKLTDIECTGNALKKLNLSGCAALTHLNCYENRLAQLDLSDNTKLKRLECDSNQLKTLDVRVNTKLTILHCGDNKLSKLNVRKNAKLKSLECHSNKLAALDLSKNTALTWLICGDNPLRTLDLSKNRKLTSVQTYGTDIRSLDVSKNTKLKYLVVAGNPKLTSLKLGKQKRLDNLECQKTGLKTLDVSGCPLLKAVFQSHIIVELWDEDRTLAWRLANAVYTDDDLVIKDGEKTLYRKGKVESVRFAQSSITLKVGQTWEPQIVTTPSTAACVCGFWPKNRKVLDVIGDDGTMKALKKGSTTVTVKTSNGKTAKIKVTVA